MNKIRGFIIVSNNGTNTTNIDRGVISGDVKFKAGNNIIDGSNITCDKINSVIDVGLNKFNDSFNPANQINGHCYVCGIDCDVITTFEHDIELVNNDNIIVNNGHISVGNLTVDAVDKITLSSSFNKINANTITFNDTSINNTFTVNGNSAAIGDVNINDNISCNKVIGNVGDGFNSINGVVNIGTCVIDDAITFKDVSINANSVSFNKDISHNNTKVIDDTTLNIECVKHNKIITTNYVIENDDGIKITADDININVDAINDKDFNNKITADEVVCKVISAGESTPGDEINAKEVDIYKFFKINGNSDIVIIASNNNELSISLTNDELLISLTKLTNEVSKGNYFVFDVDENIIETIETTPTINYYVKVKTADSYLLTEMSAYQSLGTITDSIKVNGNVNANQISLKLLSINQLDIVDGDNTKTVIDSNGYLDAQGNNITINPMTKSYVEYNIGYKKCYIYPTDDARKSQQVVKMLDKDNNYETIYDLDDETHTLTCDSVYLSDNIYVRGVQEHESGIDNPETINFIGNDIVVTNSNIKYTDKLYLDSVNLGYFSCDRFNGIDYLMQDRIDTCTTRSICSLAYLKNLANPQMLYIKKPAISTPISGSISSKITNCTFNTSTQLITINSVNNFGYCYDLYKNICNTTVEDDGNYYYNNTFNQVALPTVNDGEIIVYTAIAYQYLLTITIDFTNKLMYIYFTTDGINWHKTTGVKTWITSSSSFVMGWSSNSDVYISATSSTYYRYATYYLHDMLSRF